MDAAAASSTNSVIDSQSPNLTSLVKQEPPQEVTSVNMDSKEVKGEPTGDASEVKREPVEGSKDLKREPVEDSKEVKKESVKEPIEQLQSKLGFFSLPISRSIMDSREHIEKFKRYEADFKHHLISKYFSDKTIFGGNIHDVKVNIDGQNTAASRLPPFQSFVDPAAFAELIRKDSSSSTETPTTSTSNEKPPST